MKNEENKMSKEEMMCHIIRYITKKPSAKKSCCK
jgi:hypothetical protein